MVKAELVERLTRCGKVAGSIPGGSGRIILSSKANLFVLTLILVSVPPTPVLAHWHVKDPGRSDTSAGGRLQLNMHTHLT